MVFLIFSYTFPARPKKVQTIQASVKSVFTLNERKRGFTMIPLTMNETQNFHLNGMKFSFFQKGR